MLYAAGVPNEKVLKTYPQIGVASVWWEGNPCNMHLLDLGKEVKRSVEAQDMLAWQYNTIGVSDGITMGGDGMRFSLQTREIIADSIETVTCAQFHDACITIPGCDKNMPGVICCVDEIAEALNAGPDGASTSPREQPHSTPQCAQAMAELGGREEDACERMHMRDLM